MSRQNSSKRLKKYRDDVQEITRSILDLALARQNLTQHIADEKETSGADIENHAVEEKLSSEMTEYAKSSGLDQELARKIVENLIEYSKIAQRKKIYLKSIRAHLRSSKVKSVSIFGAGRMGGWFAKYFVDAGSKVLLFDDDKALARKRARELGCGYAKSFEEAAESDLIVIAIPIKATTEILGKLATYEKTTTATIRIMEISSVKSEIEKFFSKNILPNNLKVYSIHPLFGSIANAFAVNTLIEIGRDSGFVKAIFPHYRTFQMSAQNHDRLMATMLTLPHVHALSFANSVARKKIPRDIHGPSFDHLLELSKRVLRENERVYYEIQATNPFADRALVETLNSVRKLRKLMKDESTFKKFFKETGRVLN
ncbi:MAG TPA: prephenate dehydrogenase/arogenate dehydrogenase family protein [Nitrososphaerales archaeon]|nr:prephenate dehydrogenase/arogenate dehydrogenase family protein [Nitrososphaerales archaeon]